MENGVSRLQVTETVGRTELPRVGPCSLSLDIGLASVHPHGFSEFDSVHHWQESAPIVHFLVALPSTDLKSITNKAIRFFILRPFS